MSRLLRTLFLVLVTIGAFAAVFGVIAAVGVARLTVANAPAGAARPANGTGAPAAAGAAVPTASAALPAAAVQGAGAAARPANKAADESLERIVLNAADARLRGTVLRRESDTHDVIGWAREADWVDWPLQTPPGEFHLYHVDLTYACPPGHGGDFTLEVAEQSLPGKAEPTGSARDFKPVRVGLLRVPGGKSRLALRPAGKPRHDLMRLRRIDLIPARPGDPPEVASIARPEAPPARPAAPPASPEHPANAAGTVVGFTLIDTSPNTPVGPLTDRMTLELGALPAKHMSIRADVEGNPGSVHFGLDKKERLHVENNAPYAINADDHGKFIPWEFPTGEHTLTATPFTGKDATGRAGPALAVHFKVVAAGHTRKPIVLKAEDAKFRGDGIRVEDQNGYHNVGFWQSVDQSVRWEVPAGRGGKYHVRLSYAVDNGAGGGDFELRVGDQKLTGHTEGTGGWQQYRVLEVGAVTLPAGKVTLTVKPTKLEKGKALMNLKQVELVPQ